MLRSATGDDLPFLRLMLYEAAGGEGPVDDIVAANAVYIRDWPRPADRGVVAEDEAGLPIGAAWFRCFTDDNHGWGYLDAQTPELAMAVAENHRGRGVGVGLLTALNTAARDQGHRALSLSVLEINTVARGLYEKMGFVAVQAGDGALTMRLALE